MTITLGTLIGSALTKRGLSQKELAYKVGLSPQYINDIVAGKRTPKEFLTLRKLSDALDIDHDVISYAAGVLPPYLPTDVSPECIKAAFAAMREVLYAGHTWAADESEVTS